MHAKYSTLWIFWGLAGWKLCLRPLRFFYVQLKVSQTSHLIYLVLWAPRHDIAARCPSVYDTWQSQAVTHPIMNRARRCLTSVSEPTPMSERRISLPHHCVSVPWLMGHPLPNGWPINHGTLPQCWPNVRSASHNVEHVLCTENTWNRS